MMSGSVVNASYAHAQQGAAPSLHTQPGHHRPPGTMQKPGIPAQQMQRTDTLERAGESGLVGAVQWAVRLRRGWTLVGCTDG